MCVALPCPVVGYPHPSTPLLLLLALSPSPFLTFTIFGPNLIKALISKVEVNMLSKCCENMLNDVCQIKG